MALAPGTRVGAYEIVAPLGAGGPRLRPANIRVTPDGTWKVLAFGLATPLEPVDASANATHSPTLTSPALTTRGVVLGTASYIAMPWASTIARWRPAVSTRPPRLNARAPDEEAAYWPVGGLTSGAEGPRIPCRMR